MHSSLKYELNIALTPNDDLAEKHIAISQSLASKYPAVVQLNDVRARLAFAPHLTLYQVAIPHTRLSGVVDNLNIVADDFPFVDLQTTKYAYNAEEDSLEVQYEVTDELLALQKSIIDSVNPLRDGLLIERDPGGNKVSDLLEAEAMLGENIRTTGFAEVGDPANGGLFRPHVTLNWFRQGTEVDENDAHLREVDVLSGSFTYLGVYLLGPYGTCAQKLVQYPLH